MHEKIKFEDLPAILSSFINKHQRDRSYLEIEGYEFEVLSIGNVVIPMKNINRLDDGAIQFYGETTITRRDPKSMVLTSNIPISFNGIAWFVEDIDGDENLFKMNLLNLSQIS